jgi:hypothetical protein
MTDNTDKNTDIRLKNLMPPWKPGESGNPNGNYKGTRHFPTMFEEAIKIIVKEQRIPVQDPEIELVIKGIIQAFRGNYSFWKDIMDRTYGSTGSSLIDARTQIVNIQVTDEMLEQEALELLQSRGFICTKG